MAMVSHSWNENEPKVSTCLDLHKRAEELNNAMPRKLIANAICWLMSKSRCWQARCTIGYIPQPKNTWRIWLRSGRYCPHRQKVSVM